MGLPKKMAGEENSTGARFMRASAVQNWCLRLWSNSQSSYVSSTQYYLTQRRWLTELLLQAWRLLSRSFLPESQKQDLLAYTPMFHSKMFGEKSNYRDAHFQPLKS